MYVRASIHTSLPYPTWTLYTVLKGLQGASGSLREPPQEAAGFSEESRMARKMGPEREPEVPEKRLRACENAKRT